MCVRRRLHRDHPTAGDGLVPATGSTHRRWRPGRCPRRWTGVPGAHVVRVRLPERQLRIRLRARQHLQRGLLGRQLRPPVRRGCGMQPRLLGRQLSLDLPGQRDVQRRLPGWQLPDRVRGRRRLQCLLSRRRLPVASTSRRCSHHRALSPRSLTPMCRCNTDTELAGSVSNPIPM